MLPGFSEVPGLCFSFLRQAFAANDEARLMSDISLTMKKRSCRYQHHTQSPESRGACFHQPDHIMTHSTGHESRLKRIDNTSVFGNEVYSKEELVAEIGAAALVNICSLETWGSFKNSAAYIANWLTVLKNDKKMIVSAAGKAEKAIKLILGEQNNTTEAE